MNDTPARTNDGHESDLPSVAIVIPTYNEEGNIKRCLDSLAGLDYPASRFEVVVVDNGSTDETVRIVNECGVRVVSEPAARVGGVRNRGVAETTSDLLAFIDADCEALPTWLSGAAEEFRSHPETGAVGGNYLVYESATWIERVWAVRPVKGREPVPYLAAGNLIISRQLFDRVGGFEAALNAGEDEELGRRIRETDMAIVKRPECGVYHLGYPRSLTEVYRRERWHGSSQLDSASSLLDKTVISVHLFVLGLLALPPAALVARTTPWPLLGALALVLGLPFLAGLRRWRKESANVAPISRILPLWIVFGAYYVGRTVGLALNYRARLFHVDEKTNKK